MADSSTALPTNKKQRRRPVNACATCRARKVKCDERPDGCLNCERLQLTCVHDGAVARLAKRSPDSLDPPSAIKRKRTFRSCVACRDSKVKCSGERPTCSRCHQRLTPCVYDADANEPAWVHSISVGPLSQPSSSTHPQVPRSAFSSASVDISTANCPPGLTWLFSQELPPRAKLHLLLEAYFNNVQPIRVFAFEHKPTFMQMLDEGQLTDQSGQALLHIMCALGAKFYALEYAESFAPLPKELMQAAGTQWAKIAEEMFFADYSTISTTKLKVLILLHDQEARAGNYAGSFLLTGLVVRMAHALQLNNEASTDVLCKSEGPNEASVRECHRRLMWACYMLDVWAGSGVDHLTILNERDIKIQLPCNERQFLLQIPCVTERLDGQVLDFVPKEDAPEKPTDNLGMAAYYVRIVSIWRRVLRFSKHMDSETPPWSPDSDFSNLISDVQAWKASLPSWLDFSASNIYIRRESHQLGALFLNHCMYHHVLCDIYRISLPDLYRTSNPCIFPPSHAALKSHLQHTCFEHAQRLSILVATVLSHGIKHFADPILPSLVYNANRIMLHHIARILDRTAPGAETVVARTIDLITSNNSALDKMSAMYPLAHPLYLTTHAWLHTVREAIARGSSADTYIAPQDPGQAREEARLLPPIEQLLGSGPEADANAGTGADAGAEHDVSSLATLADVAAHSHEHAHGQDHVDPLFNLDLDELQNFFEWDAGSGGVPGAAANAGQQGENQTQTQGQVAVAGFEAFGPMGTGWGGVGEWGS